MEMSATNRMIWTMVSNVSQFRYIIGKYGIGFEVDDMILTL